MDTELRVQSVTGVDIELEIAGPGGRSYAFIIDLHIRFLAALALFSVAAFVGSRTSPAQPPASLLAPAGIVSAAIYFLYHPVLEVLMRGRTPGKRIAGVRIVTREGGVPGVGALLIRNLFRLIDCQPGVYLVGLAATLMTRQSVRIGDIAAGTLLVYDEPTDARRVRTLSSAAVDRLGIETAGLVTELLERWPSLEPARRDALARQLLAKAGQATDERPLRAQLEQLVEEPSS